VLDRFAVEGDAADAEHRRYLVDALAGVERARLTYTVVPQPAVAGNLWAQREENPT